MDVKIKLLDEFCFRFIYFSGLYDIWSHFSRLRMIVFEHKECPAWNARDVLFGTHEMSCLEHTRCPAWNTRDVLFGTHEMTTKRAKYSVSQVKRISVMYLRTYLKTVKKHKNCTIRVQFLCYVTFSNANSQISSFFSKLRTDVYPSNKARIGAKLWQNAFQTICKFSCLIFAF